MVVIIRSTIHQSHTRSCPGKGGRVGVRIVVIGHCCSVLGNGVTGHRVLSVPIIVGAADFLDMVPRGQIAVGQIGFILHENRNLRTGGVQGSVPFHGKLISKESVAVFSPANSDDCATLHDHICPYSTPLTDGSKLASGDGQQTIYYNNACSRGAGNLHSAASNGHVRNGDSQPPFADKGDLARITADDQLPVGLSFVVHGHFFCGNIHCTAHNIYRRGR